MVEDPQEIMLIPVDMLQGSCSFLACPACGRLSRSKSLCEFCTRTWDLVQTRILENCGFVEGGLSATEIITGLEGIGIVPEIVTAAFLVLLIEGRLQEVRP